MSVYNFTFPDAIIDLIYMISLGLCQLLTLKFLFILNFTMVLVVLVYIKLFLYIQRNTPPRLLKYLTTM